MRTQTFSWSRLRCSPQPRRKSETASVRNFPQGAGRQFRVGAQYLFFGTYATNRLDIAPAYYGNELERAELRQIFRV